MFLNCLYKLIVLLPGRECISVEPLPEVAAVIVLTIIFLAYAFGIFFPFSILGFNLKLFLYLLQII